MAAKILRVLTYNLKLLPGPFGGGDADLARVAEIVRRLVPQKRVFDVLCLQEVFDEEARALLAKGLRGHFPHQVTKCSDNDVFQEDSGLFFASRYPIAGHRFVEFDATTGGDAFADKGIFGARLTVGGTTVLVFNTHLQSSIEHSSVRAEQLRQARGFIRGALARTPGRGGVVALAGGDFNVVGEVEPTGGVAGAATSEYRRMLANLGWPRDLYRAARPTDPGLTWDGSANVNMIPANDLDRQRLDYLFAYDHLPAIGDEATPALRQVKVRSIEVCRFETKPKVCLSDHFGVGATLEL